MQGREAKPRSGTGTRAKEKGSVGCDFKSHIKYVLPLVYAITAPSQANSHMVPSISYLGICPNVNTSESPLLKRVQNVCLHSHSATLYSLGKLYFPHCIFTL